VISKVDSRVQDSVALDEIELYGDLMIAASQSEGRMSRDEIDAVLGVAPRPDQPLGGPAAQPRTS